MFIHNPREIYVHVLLSCAHKYIARVKQRQRTISLRKCTITEEVLQMQIELLPFDSTFASTSHHCIMITIITVIYSSRREFTFAWQKANKQKWTSQSEKQGGL